MVRFLLLALLVFFVARAIGRLLVGVVEGALGQGPGARSGTPEEGVPMVRDPVCGTFVVPSKALTSHAGSEVLYFCSEECRRRYHTR